MTSHSSVLKPTAPPARRIRLFRKRLCPVPTWQGWLLIATLCLLAGWFLLRNAYGFLAMNDPVSKGAVIVEGWASDHTFRRVMQEFNLGSYDCIYVVGGPIERGARLSSHDNYAQLGKAILTAEGMPADKVVAVPAPFVAQDRTYASFVALRRHLEQYPPPEPVHLFSEGAHARRSRLMLGMVLDKKMTVGVTAVPPVSFDPSRWWATSAGFKSVLGETLSYFYARVLFRPM